MHSFEDLLAGFATTVLKASADTVAILAPSSRVEFLSTTAPHLLGHPPGEWLGRRLLDHVHPRDVDLFTKLLTPQTNGDGPRRDNINVRILNSQGEWSNIQAIGFTWVESETLSGYVVSFRNPRNRSTSVGSAALAKETLRDAAEGSAFMDNRKMLVADLFPSILSESESCKNLCILTVKMSNFTAICDDFGRHHADHMILKTATTIASVLRREDVVARVHDQQLVVAGANMTSLQAVNNLAHRILDVCHDLRFPSDTSFDASIGFALTSQGDDLSQVLDFALETEQLSSDTATPTTQRCAVLTNN